MRRGRPGYGHDRREAQLAAVEDLAKRDIKAVNLTTQVNIERLEQLADLVAKGKLKAPRIKTFPLEQAREAFKLIGNSGGKLVVKI